MSFFPDRVTRTNGIITGRPACRQLRVAPDRGLEFTGRAGSTCAWRRHQPQLRRHLSARQAGKAAAEPAPYRDIRDRWVLVGDIGLKWKHNAAITYSRDGLRADLFANLSQRLCQPGPARERGAAGLQSAGEPYIIYNASVSQRVADRLTLTAGIRNIFNTDPPFAITYDSDSGSGGSWDPRVADPRGRSFTLSPTGSCSDLKAASSGSAGGRLSLGLDAI
jgi:iron complex outermembrane receptor protein